MPERSRRIPMPLLMAVFRTDTESWSRYAGEMTWRRLYVPQVGQAVCCSFCSWHCGHCMSAGAAVFHCARRDLVLLRDILRFGTATSALLSFVRVVPAGPGRGVGCVKQPQRRPSGVGAITVAVPGADVREAHTALHAQAGTIARAERREREREHDRIAAHRLEIEQVSVEVVILFCYLAVPLTDGQVAEELLELDLNA